MRSPSAPATGADLSEGEGATRNTQADLMRGQALWCKTDEVSDITTSSCCVPVRIDKEQ